MTEELIPGQEPYLAPGVRGYTVEVDGALYVPLLIADQPGSGAVGRYLDSLRDRIVKVPCVLSERLAEMLRRRGFRLEVEQDPGMGPVEVWVWRPV